MIPKMRRWILSDSHLGHSAIQKHCRRPADVDSIFTKNCKRLIGPDDIVIHCGDVAFNFFDLDAWFKDMPGRWVLVRGNHDSHSISYYMDHGFVFACDAFEFSGCYFTHKPAEFLPPGCQYNVHGHLHNRFPATYRKYQHSRLFALEHSKYEPMLLEKFLRKGCPGGEVLPDDPQPEDRIVPKEEGCDILHGAIHIPGNWTRAGDFIPADGSKPLLHEEHHVLCSALHTTPRGSAGCCCASLDRQPKESL